MPKRPLGPQKMLKCGLRWVTTNRGNLTLLIFVRPHSVTNQFAKKRSSPVLQTPYRNRRKHPVAAARRFVFNIRED
jgi:hypothetical protein